MIYPDQLHLARLRESCRGWFPGRTETQVREALFRETEDLRGWYQCMLEGDPPYRRAPRGYVALYMPRGHFWFKRLVSDHPRLRAVVSSARSVLVVGCGPAPELWSLFQYLSSEATVTLLDAEIDVWEPFVRGFTVPLVVESRGLMGLAAEPPWLEFQAGTHGSIEGRFDLIVAQQVLNEIAVRPVRLNRGHAWPLTALSTITAWRRSRLRPGGAIVVVDGDSKERRLRQIEENLPCGTCERGSLSHGMVRCAREVAAWLTGPWGRCVPRRRAPTKYLLVYC